MRFERVEVSQNGVHTVSRFRAFCEQLRFSAHLIDRPAGELHSASDARRLAICEFGLGFASRSVLSLLNRINRPAFAHSVPPSLFAIDSQLRSQTTTQLQYLFTGLTDGLNYT